MNKFTILYLAIALIATQSYGQKDAKGLERNTSSNKVERCSSMEYNQQLMKLYPKMNSIQKIKSNLKNKNRSRTSSPNAVARIPVVVHVIHNGQPIGTGPNLSDAHVQSQIDVLNEDFRRMAGTRGFNDHVDGADTMIEFYLAKEDPNCNPTTGIDRIDYSSINTSWSGPGGNTDTVLKPETIWDSSRYLNIWTVVFSDTSNLGYAQFPGGPEGTDGVVIGYDIFGSEDAPGVDVLDTKYNLGRTTTHEVGHFFGLYHTFNGLSCSGSGDFIDDTPQINQENYDCPSPIPDSCPSDPGDDMIENYMDYTDDFCMNIFTNGQSEVMNGYLQDPSFRFTLANSGVSDTPASSVSYDGSIKIVRLNEDACTGTITPEIEISNFGTVTLTSATVEYNINGGSLQSFNYSGSLEQGESELIVLPQILPPDGSNFFQVSVSQSNTDQRECNNDDNVAFFGQPSYTDASQIIFTLTTDDFPEETSWEFRDGNGAIIASGGGYSSSTDRNKTFTETFNVSAEDCYSFTIFDSESDGLCCAFGLGSYELKTDDGTLIFSGGEFLNIETTQISTITLTIGDYFDDNSVRLFPNPATDRINIKIGSANNLADGLEIYNMLGQRLLVKDIKTLQDQSIDVSAFNDGMYFIKLFKDGSSESLPFIIK